MLNFCSFLIQDDNIQNDNNDPNKDDSKQNENNSPNEDDLSLKRVTPLTMKQIHSSKIMDGHIVFIDSN